jgi:uncharacterized BrkB/YihY/UPF0761 family membrane protein
MPHITATFRPARPAGFTAIGTFFYFGALMATYAAITLLFPGTMLDRGWALNPTAHVQLLSLGRVMGVPFLVLAFALLFAAIGWFRRRRWGWNLGTAIIAVNMLGDLLNMFRGQPAKGAVGVAVAGLLLMYLLRRDVRQYFVTDVAKMV